MSTLSAMQKSASGVRGPAPRRFVILGLPRSGSTYLMTLLNSHPRIFCSGEQFNPYAVVGIGGERDDSFEAVVAGRDADPAGFLERFFTRDVPRDVDMAGFKFMLGHNVAGFQALTEQPDIKLIYVWRENRLAQVASLIKASRSKRWAQTRRDSHVEAKITASPRQISHRWHENAMMDHLFATWLEQQPHDHISLEYRELFAPGFETRICDFLGVAPSAKMKSELVKQGANTIEDRFEDPRAIRYYFKSIGHERWLEDEL
ncbi:sulfotransferase [Primorskyibacter sp. 2E233]|uniref:sulfotransferase n=1 Tax=Primorskyibacter sp. 2E233 TaxID=3413431 RepID=UPI003BF3FF8F